METDERDSVAEATREKALAAERSASIVRAAVIALNVFVFFVLMDKTHSNVALAWAVTAVAVPYGAYVVVAQPARKFPVLMSASFTSLTDAILIVLWILATGGYESPFYVLWYVSIAAIAFRFGPQITLATTALYAALYVAMLVAERAIAPHLADVVVRTSYILFIGQIGAYLSRETAEQTAAKIRMRDLMLQTKRAEEALRESDHKLRESLSLLNATLDSTTDGLLAVDREGKIRSFNRRFVELWRIPQEVLDSRDDARAIQFVLDQLKEPDGFARKVRELYADPSAESFDVLEFKDGRVFERYSRPQQVLGNVAGRVWSFRDVTAQRRAEAEREAGRHHAQELDRLKEIDQFKTQFINTAAHELNTPMTPIKLQLHMLRQRVANRDYDSLPRSLEILDRNVDRLGFLVDDMLEAARLQAGRLRIQPRTVDVSVLVREAAESFEAAARQADIALVPHIEPRLSTEADPKRVSQAMYNLLSNAIKFTPGGGRIDVDARRTDDAIQISVRDTGAGIRLEDQPKLFLPFSQIIDAADSPRRGTGLGLYISRGIIQQHDGTLECTSEGRGLGSTFTIRLPIKPAMVATATARKQ